MSDGPDLVPGDLIDGRFEITGRLGAGGFGVVFAARQLSTGQAVAIKVMVDAAEMDRRSRFEREMRVIARLQHPNIVRLLDFGCLPDGRLFTVLVFVEGEDLAAWLKRRGPLPADDAVALMRQVLDALHHAHALGIVHRDLKPANIMVVSGGLRPQVMVLDFGIAGVVEGARGPDYVSLTTQSGVIGTPSYMAPEQLKGQLNPATDLYAWGLVLLECLTGEVVVEASSPMEAMAAQLDPTPIPIPPLIAELPLGQLLEQVLDKDADKRLPTALDVHQRLEAREATNRSVGWIIGAVALLGIGITLGLLFAPTPPPVQVVETVPSVVSAAPSSAWITDRLEAWRLAWERTAPRGEIEALAQFYHPAFASEGRDRAAWLEYKRERGQAQPWVQVALTVVETREEGDRLRVVMQQAYRSPSFNDTGRKTLIWARDSGIWRIVAEEFEAAP